MSIESPIPPDGVGCTCLRAAAADSAAPIAFNAKMNEFELRASPFTIFLYYCPFCGEPGPPSLRSSFFVEADARERRRLDALTAGVNNEAEMRAKFGAPDWEYRSVNFRELSPDATIMVMFRDGKAGVTLMPRWNPAAPASKMPRSFDHVNGRPAPAADENGQRGAACTCGQLTEYVARRTPSFRFEDGVFEFHVRGWNGVVRHCWFCGGEAPKELGIPMYLYPDPEEETRINALGAGMKSPEDAVKLFGPSCRDTKVFRYDELSRTADVQWTLANGEWNGPQYLSKYVGPKER